MDLLRTQGDENGWKGTVFRPSITISVAYRLRKNYCFVLGHDFSRAVNVEIMSGFRVCVRTGLCNSSPVGAT